MSKLNEKATVNYFELLLYMLPEHKSINKITIPPKIVVSLKQIPKQELTLVLWVLFLNLGIFKFGDNLIQLALVPILFQISINRAIYKNMQASSF